MFIYVPSIETGEDSERLEKATLKRNQTTASMFTVNTTENFAVSGIILDGGAIINTETGTNSGMTTEANGGIVNVAEGKLTVETGATLQNSVTTGNGGAVYVADGATMEMTGGKIIGNYCTEDGTGAGIYLAEGSTLYLSGSPDFGGSGIDDSGNISTTDGNFRTGTLEEKLNGGKEYTLARQDIFIAGYESESDEDTSAASLVVNGDIIILFCLNHDSVFGNTCNSCVFP